MAIQFSKDSWHKMAIQTAQCLSERVERVRKKRLEIQPESGEQACPSIRLWMGAVR